MAYNDTYRGQPQDPRVDAAVRSLEVPEQIDRLKSSVKNLYAITDLLNGRLEPFLRCEPPLPEKETIGRGEPASPFARQLHDLNREFQNIASRIEGVLNRLEV